MSGTLTFKLLLVLEDDMSSNSLAGVAPRHIVVLVRRVGHDVLDGTCCCCHACVVVVVAVMPMMMVATTYFIFCSHSALFSDILLA